MSDLFKGAVLWVENVLGDVLFVVFDKLMNLMDRHVDSPWVWDDEEV